MADSGTSAPASDEELIAAGESILANLRSLDSTTSRDFRRVAWLFGIPFFLYLSPAIYDALIEAGIPSLLVFGVAVGVGLLGAVHYFRRRHHIS